MTPTFSFVIPTKQEGDYIEQTLRSLRAGSDAAGLKVEIVVVDGGSSDGTAEKAERLADLVLTDAPLAATSIAHARNIGADAARGEFLFHTDADVLFPDLGRLLREATVRFRSPNVLAAMAPVMPYPWDSSRRDYLIHRLANAFFRSSLYYGALFSRGECQIVRRSAFEEVGGYTGRYISGEDCDLFRRLNRMGQIVYLSDSCVWHSPRRFHQSGYLRTFGVYLREWIWMNAFRRSFIREWPVVR